MESNIKQFTKEINGVTYKAQFTGLRNAMRGQKQCGGDSEKTADYVLKNVIYDPPGLTIENFDSFDELNPVVSFGIKVMNGNFREKEKTGAPGGSEE